MTDTLTPHEAARAIADASRYEEALVQRTEGLTQMVWGIATPAIFVTYAFFSSIEGLPRALLSALWLPWVAAAAATTFALWRSAALVQPRVGEGASTLGMLARVAGVSALFVVAFWILRPQSYVVPLAVVGGVWILMAITNLMQATPLGRRLWALAGAAMAATAVALATLDPPVEVGGSLALLMPFVSVLTGAYQTLRG